MDIHALNDFFRKFEQDKPIVALRAALKELISEERHCEIFLRFSRLLKVSATLKPPNRITASLAITPTARV